MPTIPIISQRELDQLNARLQSLEQELADSKADALRLHKDKMTYLDAKIALEQELERARKAAEFGRAVLDEARGDLGDLDGGSRRSSSSANPPAWESGAGVGAALRIGGVVSAIISADQKYRYRLTRTLNAMGDSVCFIMLNPSTADAERDDNTIRKCKKFVLSLGYGQLEVVNLFAYRATDPDVLYGMSKETAIGPENDKHIAEAACAARITICAWGNHGVLHGRDREVIQLLCFHGVSPFALKINDKSGQPAHPLYLKPNAQPISLRRPT